MWFYLSDCIRNNPKCFFRGMSQTRPDNALCSFPPKNQNPRQQCCPSIITTTARGRLFVKHTFRSLERQWVWVSMLLCTLSSIYTAQPQQWRPQTSTLTARGKLIFLKQTECRTKWEMTFHCAWLKILDTRVFTDHDMIFKKWKTATMLDFNEIVASKAILANAKRHLSAFT